MNANELSPERLRIVEPPRSCSYVAEEVASIEYRLFSGLEPEQVEFLLERGWRKFGTQVFRPACRACSRCVPIRVDVQNFQPSKSQRKIWRRNQHISVSVHLPEVTQEHLDLYNQWHEDMTARRDWPESQSTVDEYAGGFLRGTFPSLHELRYFDGETLVGLGLVDVLPHSLSSAYFYHHPDWRPLGPGTFSLMCEIDLARRLQLEFLYLGYWIDKCPSMAYKNRFLPAETLLGSPSDEVLPTWEPYSP